MTKKGGKSKSFEDKSTGDLRSEAKEIGVEGTEVMNKNELMKALTDYYNAKKINKNL